MIVTTAYGNVSQILCLFGDEESADEIGEGKTEPPGASFESQSAKFAQQIGRTHTECASLVPVREKGKEQLHRGRRGFCRGFDGVDHDGLLAAFGGGRVD